MIEYKKYNITDRLIELQDKNVSLSSLLANLTDDMNDLASLIKSLSNKVIEAHKKLKSYSIDAALYKYIFEFGTAEGFIDNDHVLLRNNVINLTKEVNTSRLKLDAILSQRRETDKELREVNDDISSCKRMISLLSRSSGEIVAETVTGVIREKSAVVMTLQTNVYNRDTLMVHSKVEMYVYATHGWHLDKRTDYLSKVSAKRAVRLTQLLNEYNKTAQN